MRKYIFYVICIPILFLVYFFTITAKEDNVINDDKSNDLERLIFVNYENSSSELELNDYIIGVLACEMPALFEEDALKSLSVAIRTYFYNKYLLDNDYVFDKMDQCYIDEDGMMEKWEDNFSKYYKKMKDAVLSTKDEVIFYDGNVINALYFSMSNGMTEDNSYVFGNKLPYLVSVSSRWDTSVKNFQVSTIFSVNEFLNKIGINENYISNLNILSYTDSGRVFKISVNNKEYLSTEFRRLLGLRSTDFTISYDENNVIVVTKGYGHGVGLSQYGANEMAKLGYSYKEILKYYYKDVEIKNISV